MFWNKYPYTNFHELNLDWILQTIKEMDESLSEFEALNKITFDGEWDITKQYPAWCIVNWNNGQEGYISIKPVPAGVTINNTDYWVSVVNYTATIADLQNRIVALENDSITVHSDIDNLEEVTGLLADRRYIIIGDSYEANSYFGTYLTEDLGLDTTFTAIGDHARVNAAKNSYVVANGGLGFTNNGGGPDLTVNGFLEIMQSNETYIEDPDTITDIVVLGGANDSFWSIFNSGVQSNMNDFADYIEATYPNAKLWLGFIARIRGTNPSGITSNDLISAYYNYTNNARFTYMHGVEFSLYIGDGLITTDNLHPIPAGGKKIAEKASQILKGGIPVSSWTWANDVRNVVFDSSVGSSGSGLALAPKILDGQHWHVDVPSFNWAPVNNTLNGEFTVTIGTQDAFYLNQPVDIPVNASWVKTGGGIEGLGVTIELSGYDIILKGHFNESGFSWTSHTNVANVFIFQNSFEIPLMYC